MQVKSLEVFVQKESMRANKPFALPVPDCVLRVLELVLGVVSPLASILVARIQSSRPLGPARTHQDTSAWESQDEMITPYPILHELVRTTIPVLLMLTGALSAMQMLGGELTELNT
ncbi:hypothetical protein VTH82DRAFT_5068 [Thermothelomyces myriococcoides]